MNDEFEQRLSSIELHIPPENLRDKILASISIEAPPPAANIPWWREFFWPCPQAWVGMAASWAVMLGLNFNDPAETKSVGYAAVAKESAEKLHRQWYAEEYAVLDAADDSKSDADEASLDRPRSHLRRHEFDYA